MGKPTGFLEFERKSNVGTSPLERIKNYKEFHTPLPENERRQQASRCMDCGVPFCQNGKPIMGMVSGCPLNNLVPEWNDLLYTNEYEAAAHRLLMTNNFLNLLQEFVLLYVKQLVLVDLTVILFLLRKMRILSLSLLITQV